MRHLAKRKGSHPKFVCSHLHGCRSDHEEYGRRTAGAWKEPLADPVLSAWSCGQSGYGGDAVRSVAGLPTTPAGRMEGTARGSRPLPAPHFRHGVENVFTVT